MRGSRGRAERLQPAPSRRRGGLPTLTASPAPATATPPRPARRLLVVRGLCARAPGSPFPPVPLPPIQPRKGPGSAPPPHDGPRPDRSRGGDRPRPADPRPAARPRDGRHRPAGPDAGPLLLGGPRGSGLSAPRRRRGVPGADGSRCLRRRGRSPSPSPASRLAVSVPSKNPPTSSDDTARAGTGSRPPSRAPALRPGSAEPRRARTPPPASARQRALRRQALAFSSPPTAFSGGWGRPHRNNHRVFFPLTRDLALLSPAPTCARLREGSHGGTAGVTAALGGGSGTVPG